MCLIKEWTSLKVTPELIRSRQWARSHAFLDTGLRCGDIVALDWDIDDEALLNALLDEVVEQGLVDESPFVRIGKAPRELWVYRTAEKIGKRTTGHFLPAGADPVEASGYAVEILGAGCQFAAFGQRDETTAYSWPGATPLEHVYMDLPAITLAQVEALKSFCIGFFERNGLERRSPAGGTDGGYTHAYDLDPGMVFNVKDMGDMTVAELTEALRVNPDEMLRCSVEAFRPTSGSWAGMASLVGDDLCVSDHGTYTSHFPPSSAAGTGMEALGQLLATRFPAAVPAPPKDLDMRPEDAFDDNLAKALERYIYVASDGLVVDTCQGFMTNTPRQFGELMNPYHEVKLGARGGEEIRYLATQWSRHPRRRSALDMQMRPDCPAPVYSDNLGQHLNTYAPPQFPPGGDASGGLDLIARLLPRADERRYFMQWLGFKLLHPEIPGPAIVMVARDAYGTGRGTLITMLARLFGEGYVKRIDFNTLTGKGHQSQYNEWLVDALLVAVDEAQETDGATSRWQARSNAYEHLKTIVDPSARPVHVKRKGVKNIEAQTYASLLIASNHGDALVIPPNDRRFAVLENGAPMPQEYWAAFRLWLDRPANVGALATTLRELDMTGYNPYVAPPMTAAKADMIDAGTSDLDRAAAVVVTSAVGVAMVKEQFMLHLETAMADLGFDFPDDWQRVAERLFMRKTRRLPGPDRVVVEGKLRPVRGIGSYDAGLPHNDLNMLEEIAKNGPLVRPIKTSGKVISFTGSRAAL